MDTDAVLDLELSTQAGILHLSGIRSKNAIGSLADLVVSVHTHECRPSRLFRFLREGWRRGWESSKNTLDRA
jgi:hypothetical protein